MKGNNFKCAFNASPVIREATGTLNRIVAAIDKAEQAYYRLCHKMPKEPFTIYVGDQEMVAFGFIAENNHYVLEIRNVKGREEYSYGGHKVIRVKEDSYLHVVIGIDISEIQNGYIHAG